MSQSDRGKPGIRKKCHCVLEHSKMFAGGLVQIAGAHYENKRPVQSVVSLTVAVQWQRTLNQQTRNFSLNA